jgi:hypothetical protein
MPRTQLPVSKEGWSALSDARKPVARSAEMLTQLLVFACSPKGQIAIQLAASANRAPKSYAVPITSRGFTSGYSDTRDEKGPRDLIIDKNAWLGASGSPIFLENGAVIGILVRRGIDNGAAWRWAGRLLSLRKC